MNTELSILKSQLAQAEQNFSWAEADYVDISVMELKAARMRYDLGIRRLKTEDRKEVCPVKYQIFACLIILFASIAYFVRTVYKTLTDYAKHNAEYIQTQETAEDTHKAIIGVYNEKGELVANR